MTSLTSRLAYERRPPATVTFTTYKMSTSLPALSELAMSSTATGTITGLNIFSHTLTVADHVYRSTTELSQEAWAVNVSVEIDQQESKDGKHLYTIYRPDTGAEGCFVLSKAEDKETIWRGKVVSIAKLTAKTTQVALSGISCLGKLSKETIKVGPNITTKVPPGTAIDIVVSNANQFLRIGSSPEGKCYLLPVKIKV